MFPTFSGSSRRRPDVNLSGRHNANPFAKQGATQTSQNPVADAQQTRLARQQERERAQAAASIQRVWRGHATRRRWGVAEREKWDTVEKHSAATSGDTHEPISYDSEDQAYSQLVSLLRFLDTQDDADVERLWKCYLRIYKTATTNEGACSGGPWPKAYLRLELTCLAGIERATTTNGIAKYLVQLEFVMMKIPEMTALESRKVYQAFRGILDMDKKLSILDYLVLPMAELCHTSIVVYQNFARFILTKPCLDNAMGHTEGLDRLVEGVNVKLLMSAVAHALRDDLEPLVFADVVRSSSHSRSSSNTSSASTGVSWLLSHLIYLHRWWGITGASENDSSFEQDFARVVSSLLPCVADQVGNGQDGNAPSASDEPPQAQNPFVEAQLSSLVSQQNIGNLLPIMSGTSPLSDGKRATTAVSGQYRMLSRYILSLLRLFPERGDDIRMWLYLGSSSYNAKAGASQTESIVHFFWQAVQETDLFIEVVQDSRRAVDLLRPHSDSHSKKSFEDQGRIVLLFVELYSFVLKIMDDEEFFAPILRKDGNPSTSRSGRASNLGYQEIKRLSTFLKHFAFTLYYNAPEMEGYNKTEESNRDITSLFKGHTPQRVIADTQERAEGFTVVGILSGVSLEYMKGAITGLLRAIYERDSRRPFLPKDHWLMIKQFDMTTFIDAVVEEEERRNQVQDAEADDGAEEESDEDDYDDGRSSGLIGTGQARRLHKLGQLRRQQRKASRKRYMQAVAPRLEILQNMPFLIPFTTRVQIFRRFVNLDMIKRRNGVVDPELWRLSHGHGMNPFRSWTHSRHQAKVRRGHEFEDAYDQFFELGTSLKEPINITFVDQFDQPEAGIDGGGVTKEFLTTVTNQAFADTEGVKLFAENEKHLMFPNPSSIDEQKQLLREGGYKENSPEFRSQIADLRKHYEFFGRIIGKCLYEGILVDIGFAPFFLLKWALTGGTGSAPRESGYRANLNDLRDFDEALYQGLIQLKNYTGDVEKDFSLNFTVTDTLNLPLTSLDRGAPRTKTITRDLIPGGSSQPVTNANRLVYISHIARHRLSTQPYIATTSFLRGLSAMIPPSKLSMFNQPELQTLVGGAPAPISIPDLRQHTVYGGVYALGDDGLEHPSVLIFWDVMTALPDADRRKVLKFVTSTPRAPLLGFGSLMPRFSIRDSGGDETRLPSTSTCVNLLKLPMYRTLEGCREKLLLAVNSGAGFDLS